MVNTHITSKQRIRDHGEVFTPDFIVNDMLDLVKNETERIESRFLEPACGDGNFLAPILERKLEVVKRKYKSSQVEFERNALLAVSSIYGVEVLEDNVNQCKERLFNIFSSYYQSIFKKKIKLDFLEAVRFILKKNILWGDARSLKTPDIKAQPIIFSHWERPFHDSRIKRHDYFFEELTSEGLGGLFEKNIYISDLGTKEFIPKSFREFTPIHYLKIICQE